VTGEEVVGIVPLCVDVHIAVAIAFVKNGSVLDPVVETLLIGLTTIGTVTTVTAITTVTTITAITTVITVQIS